MRSRCNSERDKDFARYGGRGIKVCPEWDEFFVFLADMGPRPPGGTIERLNNNGPYCKENCKWVDRVIQNNNRGNNHRITANGVSATISAHAREIGVRRQRLRTMVVRSSLKGESSFVLNGVEFTHGYGLS
jgi:hypothetical protein